MSSDLWAQKKDVERQLYVMVKNRQDKIRHLEREIRALRASVDLLQTAIQASKEDWGLE